MSVLRDNQCLTMSVIGFIARSMQFDDVVCVHQIYSVSIVSRSCSGLFGLVGHLQYWRRFFSEQYNLLIISLTQTHNIT